MKRFLTFRWCVSGLACVGAAVAAPPAAPVWYEFHHEHVLGTSLELRFAATSAAQAETAEAAALAEIDRLGRILSSYDAASEFRSWLSTRDEARPVSAELFEVLALFDAWRDRTGGALDPSAEVAGRLWRSAAQQQRVPTPAELDAAVAAVRQPHWRLDAANRTATHLSAAPLALNSFAKSYIIDRACIAALAEGKVTTALVNLGGDLVVRGAAQTRIAVADPAAYAENDTPLLEIALRDRAVATSGGYRRGVEIAGHWYSHLVDPRTGRPVDHVQSATVVARRATDAGALATALCVLTPEEGLRLATATPGAECLLVLSHGRRLTTAGWSSLEVPATPTGPSAAFAAIARTGAAGGPLAASAPAEAGFELAVKLEVASISGGRARRPFVAVWIEDKDAFPVRTLALWYNGARWLPDLRSWYRADQVRGMAEGKQIVSTVSSATRGPGKYTLKWDGKDNQGHPVAPGRYTLMIEAAREHGTHQLINADFDTTGADQHVDLPDNLELASASIDFRRKQSAR